MGVYILICGICKPEYAKLNGKGTLKGILILGIIELI